MAELSNPLASEACGVFSRFTQSSANFSQKKRPPEGDLFF
jgi:hypothetical protein